MIDQHLPYVWCMVNHYTVYTWYNDCGFSHQASGETTHTQFFCQFRPHCTFLCESIKTKTQWTLASEIIKHFWAQWFTCLLTFQSSSSSILLASPAKFCGKSFGHFPAEFEGIERGYVLEDCLGYYFYCLHVAELRKLESICSFSRWLLLLFSLCELCLTHEA